MIATVEEAPGTIQFVADKVVKLTCPCEDGFVCIPVTDLRDLLSRIRTEVLNPQAGYPEVIPEDHPLRKLWNQVAPWVPFYGPRVVIFDALLTEEDTLSVPMGEWKAIHQWLTRQMYPSHALLSMYDSKAGIAVAA